MRAVQDRRRRAGDGIQQRAELPRMHWHLTGPPPPSSLESVRRISPARSRRRSRRRTVSFPARPARQRQTRGRTEEGADRYSRQQRGRWAAVGIPKPAVMSRGGTAGSATGQPRSTA